jgi:hypothetical protein
MTSPTQKVDPTSMLTWLHISDIHFGHGRQARHRIDQKIVCDEILRDAAEMAAQLGSPNLVFVTGAIAFKGDPQAEYPEASKWIEKLVKTVGATNVNLYLVPGNHDIDRKEALKGFARESIHLRLRKDPGHIDELIDNPAEMDYIWPKLTAYANFAEPYTAPKLTSERPFWATPVAPALVKSPLLDLTRIS